MGNGLGSFSAFAEPGRMGTVAHSTVRLFTEIMVQAHVRATLTFRSVRSPKPGSLALAGNVHLRGLGAEFLFRKSPDVDLPPDRGNRATAAIVTAGHAIPIPARPVSFTPDRDSEIWVRVSDPTRQPPWTEHFVGRALGHPLMLDRHLSVRGTLDASFTPEEFANGPRTRIRLGGELRFERGVIARFRVRDPRSQTPGPTEADVVEAVLLPEGTTVAIGRHAVWGFVGPNPWISLRILTADGTMVGSEHMLGRSVRMQ